MDNGASSYHRYLQGDVTGLEDIIKEYKDGLILYLNTYVHNLSVAEDLTEDTFFKLMVKKPLFKPRGTFKSWIYTIARNLALDYLRHNSLSLEVEYNEELQYLKENTYIDEYRIMVSQALEKLPDNYRQVLYLSFYEEFSNSEIAKMLGKNNRQIETMLYRAKQALKEQLRKEGFTGEEQ